MLLVLPLQREEVLLVPKRLSSPGHRDFLCPPTSGRETCSLPNSGGVLTLPHKRILLDIKDIMRSIDEIFTLFAEYQETLCCLRGPGGKKTIVTIPLVAETQSCLHGDRYGKHMKKQFPNVYIYV